MATLREATGIKEQATGQRVRRDNGCGCTQHIDESMYTHITDGVLKTALALFIHWA